MENEHPDRMAKARTRAPKEPETQPPADVPPAPVADEVAWSKGGPIEDRCAGCGVLVRLRREGQAAGKAYATCGRCGRRNLLVLVEGRWRVARLVG